MQRRHWGVGLTSLLALGILAWCFSSPSGAVQGPSDPGELVEPAAVAVAPPTVSQSPPRRAAPSSVSPDGLAIRPADSAEVNRIGMPSHPITPEHQRIYRENNLIGDLNDAMDSADAAGLRSRLQQYRDEYPEDAHVLQDGYALIADCLERLGPETRARAQRYYDEELASGLRRYIRRHCLEAPNR